MGRILGAAPACIRCLTRMGVVPLFQGKIKAKWAAHVITALPNLPPWQRNSCGRRRARIRVGQASRGIKALGARGRARCFAWQRRAWRTQLREYIAVFCAETQARSNCLALRKSCTAAMDGADWQEFRPLSGWRGLARYGHPAAPISTCSCFVMIANRRRLR
jgi:hypothetical protein